jgi:hypothetical protein
MPPSRPPSSDGTPTCYDDGAASLRVYSAMYVDRPPEAVWPLFADPERWADWSPVCAACLLAPGARLTAGAVLTLRLRFARLAADVRVRLSTFRPGHEIGWETGGLGLWVRHLYSLRREGRGSIVSNEEVFSGLRRPARYLVRRFFQATDLNLESLRGIKRMAEKR